ncbi:MAG: hypothetical protein KDA60_09585, partial [Planctomycetales bacterium]|nr:hypothetical protein [Planctomycetales bacterium]
EHIPDHPPGTMRTLVGDGSPEAVGQPFGVEYGPDGKLYICEVENHRLLRWDPTTRQLETIAGTGHAGYSGDGGPASEAQLNEPYEVRFDKQENIYFVEMRNHIVRRIDATSGVITTVAGTGQAGYSGDGGPAIRSQLSSPHSIALDHRGGLYIADIGNHRIRRVHLASGIISTIAGNGERQLPADGQVASGTAMAGPRALTIDGRMLWIALREGHSVWKMDLDRGILRHVAGTGKPGYSGDGGPATQATMNGPKGITLDPEGNVFVVDTENQVIRRIHVRTGTISTIAGAGPSARGYGGDNAIATAAKMDRPHGICIGPTGNVVIGDTNNHRVREVR